MEYITWGKHRLSRVCLGAAQLGKAYGIANKAGRLSDVEVNNILLHATKSGINCVDTAQSYGDSEKRIGAFIKLQTRLQNINFISKIDSDSFKLLSASSVRDSLNQLNATSLFGLLLHDSQLLDCWRDEYAEFVRSLKMQNNIYYFGVSIYSEEEFSLAVSNDDIDLIQVPFNLFDQRALSCGWLERARKAGKLIFIRSIYLQGLLQLQNCDLPLQFSDKAGPYFKEMDCLCESLELNRRELAVGFVKSATQNEILLFGCESSLQVESNVVTFDQAKPFSSKLMMKLERMFSCVDETIYNPTKWKAHA
jgi:aryl-alcohol dehydrogenase-like predicted oxidoreductase